jgi:proteasome alpha subunit
MVDIEMPHRTQMYDRTIVVFSPEGRLYQVEYARKAVNKATTTLGITFKDGVILATNKLTTKLLVPDSVEKLFKIDNHIAVATCGLIADGRVLVEFARVRAQINRLTFDEPIEIKALVRDIAERKQRLTQVAGLRPYGVSLLIAGVDDTPHLFETDPSGTTREWKAHVIGRGAKDAEKVLLDGYRDGMDKESAIELAFKALQAGEKRLTPRSVEFGIIEDKQYSEFSENKIRKALKQYLS